MRGKRVHDDKRNFFDELVAELGPEEIDRLLREHEHTLLDLGYDLDRITALAQSWRPWPHQRPPSCFWHTWGIEAGRGAGKTDAMADFVVEHVHGPACNPAVPGGHRMAMLAPTLGDALEAGYLGPSSVRAHDPSVQRVVADGGTMLRWPSGAIMRLVGGDKPDSADRFRAGGNRCLVWIEEAAAIRYLAECAAHIDFGLRMGPDPKLIFSTTPKRTDAYKEFRARTPGARYVGAAEYHLLDPNTPMVVTKAKTTDNTHLPERVVRDLYDRYGGTELGRQELLGELVDEVKGALWQPSQIVHVPIGYVIAKGGLVDLVVAVDPSGSEEGDGDACGIIVIGRGADGLIYVVDDFTLNGSTKEWVEAVMMAYRSTYFDRFSPSNVIFEGSGNMGGLAKELFQRAAPDMPIRTVYPKTSKADRAKPIAHLWQQGRARHLAKLPGLESEMTTWEPALSTYSPNRIDALVHGASYLVPAYADGGRISTVDKRMRGRA